MAQIEFTAEEKAILVQRLKRYFAESLDQELPQFDAEFLLDFVGETIGAYYYNRGLYDAKALLEAQLEAITDSFLDIEKPTDFIK